jgi:hypothetical protein
MGTVIEFPMIERLAREEMIRGDQERPAQVVILPVVRIERLPDMPADGVERQRAGRKRRRRAQRS